MQYNQIIEVIEAHRDGYNIEFLNGENWEPSMCFGLSALLKNISTGKTYRKRPKKVNRLIKASELPDVIWVKLTAGIYLVTGRDYNAEILLINGSKYEISHLHSFSAYSSSHSGPWKPFEVAE